MNALLQAELQTVPQTQPRIVALDAQPLTAEAFAPFGTILSPEGRARLPINSYGDRLDIYRETFESDQPIEWFIVQFWERKRSALFLERHMQISQSFIPVGDKPFLMVVARPDAREEDGIPALDEIRAFVVSGEVGIQLYRGTWHENPIPLSDGQVILVTSHQALTRGHQSQSAQKALEAYKQDVEKRNLIEVANLDLQVRVP